MSSKVTSQDCSQTNIEEITEYHLKFVIQKLKLFDEENDEGLKNLTLIFDFDSQVMHIDGVEDKNFPIGREISLSMSAAEFSEKLKDKQLMVNLYNDSSADLGFLKISLNNFTEKVLCDDFESEKVIVEEKFLFEEIETAEIKIVIEIENRSNFINPLKKISKKSKTEQQKEQLEEIPVSVSSIESICVNNFVEGEEQSSHLYPSSSTNKPSSTKSKKSEKCLSDIATSLELDSFSDKETIYCKECCGYSISGITCENKVVLESISKSGSFSTSEIKTSSKEVSSDACPKPAKLRVKKCTPRRRICSECFEDLSQLPENVPCHRCTDGKRKMISNSEEMQKSKKKEIFMSKIDPKFVESQVELAIRKIFGLDIEEEPKIKENQAVKCEKRMKKKKKSVKVCDKKSRPKSSIARPKTPRCAKVNQIKRASNTYKGLRVRHPGVITGHKDCQQLPPPVPRNMGWLWNAPNAAGIDEKYRAGWKPGAIKKSVSKLMDHFLKPKPAAAEPNIIEKEPKSTLKVQKKNGEYTFVMNPKNKQDHSSGDHCPPIVFKVTKKDEAKRRIDALKEMKMFGIDKNCKCESIDECYHMNNCEKLLLKRELKKVSERHCICPELTWDELNDDNESEINFEFTPPFDMKKVQKIIRVSNEETQYEPQKIEKCPSSVFEEEPVMEGRYQMLNRLRNEKLQKVKEAKEAKALKESLAAAKTREEAEKKKKAAIDSKNKGKSKAPLVMLDCPQPCIAYQAKCFNPCGEIKCTPKVYKCQPCPLPKCTIPPTCGRNSKFYQQKCCQ